MSAPAHVGDGVLDDDAPCGYVTMTPQGLITGVNATFLEWTGWARGDLVGRRMLVDLLSPGQRLYLETYVAPSLLVNGRVKEVAFDIARADGSRLPVVLNGVVVRAGDGPDSVRLALLDATERRRYERDLVAAKERAEASEAQARALAHTLQQTLLPPHLPTIEGADLAARYQPASRGGGVGGDFYDVFQVAEHEWVLLLGDVCGKGVAAAAVATRVRHVVRAVSVPVADPARALTSANEVLLRFGEDRFATVAVVRLRRVAGRWEATVALAGHPPALLVRDGAARAWGVPGDLLGVFADARFTDSRVVLNPGESLLLYTDGVTEARAGRELFGFERLVAAARGGEVDPAGGDGPDGDADALVTRVLQAATLFADGQLRDDVALLALRAP